jgi:hypothetical protein
MENKGIIYCFENEYMPGIVKVGMTTRGLHERLLDANTPGTWKPPGKYNIILAKYVENPSDAEKSLHRCLAHFTTHILEEINREFFKAKLEDVKVLFDMIPGKYWTEQDNENLIYENELLQSLKDGDHIVHKVFHKNKDQELIARYSSSDKKLSYNDKLYSLVDFAILHYDKIGKKPNGYVIDIHRAVGQSWIIKDGELIHLEGHNFH